MKASRSPFSIPRNISLGSLAIALVLLGLSLPSTLKQAQINQGIKATVEREKTKQAVQTELEIARVENDRRRADAYQKNQILKYHSISLAGYTNTPDLRPDDWLNTLPARAGKTVVYDDANACIGVIENGTFTWSYDRGQSQICDQTLNK
jgi:hypothetical protein